MLENGIYKNAISDLKRMLLLIFFETRQNLGRRKFSSPFVGWEITDTFKRLSVPDMQRRPCMQTSPYSTCVFEDHPEVTSQELKG